MLPTTPLRLRKLEKTFIREWRLHRGYTLEQLGAAIEVTGPTISRVELGRVPTVSTCLRL